MATRWTTINGVVVPVAQRRAPHLTMRAPATAPFPPARSSMTPGAFSVAPADVQTSIDWRMVALSGGVLGVVGAAGGAIAGGPKRRKMGAAIGGVVGLASGVGLSLVAASMAAKGSASAPPPLPGSKVWTGADWDYPSAMQAIAGSTLTVPVGKSLEFFSPDAAGFGFNYVTTSNAAIVAPSIPTTVTGFVAIKPGDAKLTGSFFDAQGKPVTQYAYVTVVNA